MSITLTIPPQVVPRLREGAHLQLAHGSETIQLETGRWPKGEPPLDERLSMERAWSLVDLLGWSGGIPAEGIAVDLREHAQALLAALDNVLPYMATTLAEIPNADQRRPQREAEYRAVRTFDATAQRAVERVAQPQTLMIPPALVERVCEGAYGLLVVATDDIARSAHAHVQPEPDIRLQFDRAWALLSWAHWNTSADDTGRILELPLAEHGETLLASATVTLRLLEEWLDDTDPSDPRRPAKADELRLMRQFHAQAQRAVQAAT